MTKTFILIEIGRFNWIPHKRLCATSMESVERYLVSEGFTLSRGTWARVSPKYVEYARLATLEIVPSTPEWKTVDPDWIKPGQRVRTLSGLELGVCTRVAPGRFYALKSGKEIGYSTEGYQMEVLEEHPE